MDQLPLGYSQITSLGSSTGLGTIPVGTTKAVIQAEAQSVRWRDDGTAPTATVGFLLVAGDVLEYTGKFSAIRFIQVTAGAILNVAFYKPPVFGAMPSQEWGPAQPEPAPIKVYPVPPLRGRQL